MSHERTRAPAFARAVLHVAAALVVHTLLAPAARAAEPDTARNVTERTDPAPPETLPPTPASGPDAVVPLETLRPTPASSREVGADKYPASQLPAVHNRRHVFGMTMDVGLPDGAGLGLSVRPLDWLRLGAAATYNGMAPGARLGVTLDPVPAPVGLTLTVEGGHYWSGTVPETHGGPAVAYNYANFHAGLEFGNRTNFRFLLRGGASWIDLNAATATLGSGLVSSNLSNLSYHGWISPTAKLGFSLYF